MMMPHPLALALNTNRIEFLKAMSDEQLKGEDTTAVLRALIGDRVSLRPMVVECLDGLTHLRKAVGAAESKWQGLLDVLDGRTPEPAAANQDDD